ncbi:hypothetical protein FBF83_14330 [Pseudalkalibacillus hwajinpoensis]|uniref:Uncharacterized protein n=1 Tax=Guptibacillus hwajinpoensis TaxID=208199 RepID=A0A4U1MDC3_9BACL|nr:hypothetical protein FBF83_14330 [Pseudalkalibacillus hwajinpoensis]
MERKVLDSCGTSGTGETPQARCSCAPRRLSARPAESEHPGAEINHYFYSNIVYEKSLLKIRFLERAFNIKRLPLSSKISFRIQITNPSGYFRKNIVNF